jgi:unsaturated rhamnogalacturonyl hydrolase
VAKHQDKDSGLWWQVTDQGGREGNYLEATGSAMFVYTIAKAVNHGYIPRDLLPVAVKGYDGIVNRLIRIEANGAVTLTKCCSVAGLSNGRNGSFEYYIKEPIVDNDMKGVGPFIMAGMELQKALGEATTRAAE